MFEVAGQRLHDCLSGRAADAVLFHAIDGPVTVAQVARRVQGLAPQRRVAAGRCVAVWCQDPLNAVIAWMALEGSAQLLLLLPADTSLEQARDFAARVGATAVVTDRPEGLEGFDSLADLAARADIDAPAPGCETIWMLTTSGTTGTPKLVPHTLSSLTATARRDGGFGAGLCWGLMYDPSRFAGLQVLLQALFGGSRLALAPTGSAFTERLALFATAGVNALSATPTLWRKLLMSRRAESLPLQIVTLGGEIADQRILAALQASYPQARVRHVYASTEAGVGFSVADGQEGFPSEWLKSPPAGVALRVLDDELQLRSERTARGYHGGRALRDTDGWVATGDRVEDDGSRVRFLGRLNGAINIGGEKVYPETVERVLLNHPDVAAAAVRAKKSAFSGALVEALVVPLAGCTGDAALREALQQLCRKHLPKYAVPALIRFVAALETSSSGKQDRTH